MHDGSSNTVALHDVALLGTLPRDVLAAVAQYTVTCTLHGVVWCNDNNIVTTQPSGAYLTLTCRRDNNNNNGNSNENGGDVQCWTVAVHTCGDVASTVRVQRCRDDDKGRDDHVHVSNNDDDDSATSACCVAAAAGAVVRPCLFLDASSWTHTCGGNSAAAAAATTSMTTTTATTSSATRIAADSEHKTPPQSPSPATMTTTTAATTAVSRLRGRSLQQLLRDDRALLCTVAQFLAPAPRTAAEVVAHVCAHNSNNNNTAHYTAADVMHVVRLLSRTTPRGTCELHGAGYALVDVEAYDSKRDKQLVANRAFAALAGRATARSLLRRLEVYADRDVLLAARTGGGGIMAGLAAHTRHAQQQRQQQQYNDNNGDEHDDDDVVTTAHHDDDEDAPVHKRVALDVAERDNNNDENDNGEGDDEDKATQAAHVALVRRAAAALCSAHGIVTHAPLDNDSDDEHVVSCAMAAAAAATAAAASTANTDAAACATLSAMPITTAAALQTAKATYATLLPLHHALRDVVVAAQQQQQLQQRQAHKRRQPHCDANKKSVAAAAVALCHALHTTLYTLERDMADYVNLHYYGVV